jgi:uncharacterized protein
MDAASDGSPARFAADVMLGRLTRWLRVLGHDVAYGPHLRRRTLLRCARAERRLVLTRDRALRREHPLPPTLFVASDRVGEQLAQVAAAVPLGGAAFLGRCLRCNRPLEALDRDAARPLVPAWVWETQPEIRRCPACQRCYWPATHEARMRAELEAFGLSDLVERDR